jgi:signal transduction histidine kinase
MSRLIENLLTLARADGGLQSAGVRRSGQLAEPVCRQAAALHPLKRIGFAATPARAVAGDDRSAHQLLWILLDNASSSRRTKGRSGSR